MTTTEEHLTHIEQFARSGADLHECQYCSLILEYFEAWREATKEDNPE